MEKRLLRRTMWNGQISENRRDRANEDSENVVSSDYFSAQSVMILLCLAVSLLILPLILPPLPPPPLMLLVLPVVILLFLVILAFMPSDVRNIASSYL
ncbi:hypothetical protein KSP40_PGU002286 [Platanthera guangdongensis]|uniref:ARGOS-like protein n=1 Tax=Platanthera guangdongensis TaxID=2320717 RepID=A0ABR2N5S5_9ASPA